jgi:bifunctional non-homologous end joining protein LigD
LLRDILTTDGLDPVAKTSGNKGLQVSAAVSVRDPERTSAYAQTVARTLEQSHPKLVVSRMAKNLRARKVFVDWSQNNPAKTTVSPYSLRARERPTVSTPLGWEEVEAGPPLSFTAGDVLHRVEDDGDLFAPTLDDTARSVLPKREVTGE